MFIGFPDIPFEQCEADTRTIDATGGTLAALFTGITLGSKCRAIMLQNNGSVNVKFGPTASGASWNILPGGVLTLYPKDLAKVAIKAASSTASVDLLVIF